MPTHNTYSALVMTRHTPDGSFLRLDDQNQANFLDGRPPPPPAPLLPLSHSHQENAPTMQHRKQGTDGGEAISSSSEAAAAAVAVAASVHQRGREKINYFAGEAAEDDEDDVARKSGRGDASRRVSDHEMDVDNTNNSSEHDNDDDDCDDCDESSEDDADDGMYVDMYVGR